MRYVRLHLGSHEFWWSRVEASQLTDSLVTQPPPDGDDTIIERIVSAPVYQTSLVMPGYQAPYALGNIANLPTMRGKQAACFLTFALSAGKSIDKLSTAVGQTGADVVGGLEVKRNHLDQHTDLFVERLLGLSEAA